MAGGITATFSADFRNFNEQLAEAATKLKGFEVSTKGLESQLKRVSSGFAGADIKRQAEIAATAVEKVGGVTKLTETEQKRLNATVTEALAKYRALGQDAPEQLRKLSAELKSAERASDGLGSVAKTALGTFSGFVGAQLAVGGLVSAFKSTVGAAITMNASLETTELQFQTLMGDAGKARDHVKGLFQFAASTPFETGPIIEASRKLQVFGGVALDTKKNLTLIGDAAAATGAPIDEVSNWVGRLYANLKSGQPIGEAAQRLTELAVIGPDVRKALEQVASGGGSIEEKFGVMQGALSRFTGSMELQAKTWTGLVSSFSDAVQMSIAEALKPAFEGAKRAVDGLNAAMSSDSTKAALKSIGAEVGLMAEKLTNAISGALTLTGNLVKKFRELPEAMQLGLGMMIASGPMISGISTAISWVDKLALAWKGAAMWRVAAEGGLVAGAVIGAWYTGKAIEGALAPEIKARVDAYESAAVRIAAAQKIVNQGIDPSPNALGLPRVTRQVLDLSDANAILYGNAGKAAGALAEAATGISLVVSHAQAGSGAIKMMATHTTSAGASTTNYVAELGKISAQIRALTPAQRDQMQAMKDLGYSTKEIAERMSFGEPVVVRFFDSIKDGARAAQQATRDAADALKHYTGQFQTLPAPVSFGATSLGATGQFIGGSFSPAGNFGGAGNPQNPYAGLFGSGLTGRVFTGPGMTSGLPDWMTGDIVDADPNRSAQLASIGYVTGGSAKAGFGTSLIQSLGTNLLGNLSGVIQSAFQGGGSLSKSIGGLAGSSVFGMAGSAITKAVSGLGGLGPALMGAFGAALPGIGALIGPLIGNVFGKLFGPSEGKLAANARSDYISQAGGAEGFNARLRNAQIAPEEAQRLTLSLMSANSRKEVEAAEKAIEAALARNNALLEQQRGLQSELVSAESERLRLATSLIPTADQLTQAMSRYGAASGSMGQAISQIQTTAGFKSLLEDIDLFERAGADAGGMLMQMREEISGVVRESLRLGTEIPENMKPYIAELARSGNLLDENGNAISDLSGLKWGQPVATEAEKTRKAMEGISTSIETLNLAIEDLAKALRNELPSAAASGARGVETAFAGTHPRITVDVEYNDSGYGGPEPRPMARGGIVTSPTYALIGEAGPEAVVPLSGRGLFELVGNSSRRLTTEIKWRGRAIADLVIEETPGALLARGIA